MLKTLAIPYASSLNQTTNWSLKGEWTEFSKKYFCYARPTKRYAKGAYDLFRKNEKEILARLKVGNHADDSGNELVTRDEGSMKKNATNKKSERNNYSISFPNLTTIENLVLVNSENTNISAMPLNNKVEDEDLLLI